MGCFNTVGIICPHCNAEVDEQTKNGSCTLSYKPLAQAATEDVIGISGYPITCHECRGELIVHSEITVVARVEKYVETPDTDFEEYDYED